MNKGKFQLRRIFVQIQRGITDRTLVCVFPWEVPILSEIHGSSATEVSIDELTSMNGAIRVTTQKLRQATDPLPGLREQYEAMATSMEDNPLENPELEYQRLGMVYGMHNDVALPNVEKVYGSLQQFRMMLTQFVRNGGVMDYKREATSGSILDDGDESVPIAEMSLNELRAALKNAGITQPKGATRADLEDLLTTATA